MMSLATRPIFESPLFSQQSRLPRFSRRERVEAFGINIWCPNDSDAYFVSSSFMDKGIKVDTVYMVCAAAETSEKDRILFTAKLLSVSGARVHGGIFKLQFEDREAIYSDTPELGYVLYDLSECIGKNPLE